MNTQTNLHSEFVRLAFDINRMKNKLMSILLEIYETEIYKNHGCSSIYEYGVKYARLSREVVQKALRTTKHVEDKPFLKEAIESEGIHKVALVATIATKETDKIFAKHVKNMSKPALAELAKEVRGKAKKDVPGDVCSHKQQTGAGSENSDGSRKKDVPGTVPHFESRYIKAHQKRQLLARHNNTCAYPNCKNPHDVIHHRTPFSFARNHKDIIPLCKTHHEFAHNGLIAHEMKSPAAWRLNLRRKQNFVASENYSYKIKLSYYINFDREGIGTKTGRLP